MAHRTYQSKLRNIARLLNLYITRWQSLLLAGMTPDQATALAALSTALDALIAELPANIGD